VCKFKPSVYQIAARLADSQQYNVWHWGALQKVYQTVLIIAKPMAVSLQPNPSSQNKSISAAAKFFSRVRPTTGANLDITRHGVVMFKLVFELFVGVLEQLHGWISGLGHSSSMQEERSHS